MGSNIVLIGMPGCGKSYFCNKLSVILTDYVPIDTDSLIEKISGLSISDIFNKYSEDYFRQLEHDTIKNICVGKNKIVSVGGGAFENFDNRNILLKFGTVFYLKSDLDVLAYRVLKNDNRPLLNNNKPIETLKKLLDKRETNYNKAHFVIDITSNMEDEVIKFIIGKTNETNFAC